jgi:hypothetical protein
MLEKIIVPVVSCRLTSSLESLRLLETAFFISHDGTFLTAWHVIQEVQSVRESGEGAFLLLRNSANGFVAGNIIEIYKPNQHVDIAIGKSDQKIDSFLRLADRRVKLGEDVICLGYPAHLFRETGDKTAKSCPIRYLRGYVQSDVWPEHDTVQAERRVDYCELSFPIPKGMSGSPLIGLNSNEVLGICTGTKKGSVFDTIDENEDGNTKTIYDVERIGIAEMDCVIAGRTKT